MKINNKVILTVFILLSSLTAFSQHISRQKKMERKINQIEKNLSEQKYQFSIMTIKKDSIEKINSNLLDSIKVWQKITETKIDLQNSEKKDWIDFFKNVFAEVAGGFVGALAAIWIFLSQQNKEKLKDEDKKEKEDKERVMYMKELSKSTINITKPWADGLVKVSKEIKTNREEIPLLPMVPTQDIERLLKLFDNESYFHAFLSYYGSTDENLKKFKSISHAADFIITQIRQAYETHHNALTFDHNRKIKFQNVFHDNLSLCAELTKNHTNLEFKSAINAHLVSFHAKYSTPTNLANIQNDYINPLMSTLLENWTSLEQARLILTQLKELNMIKDDIEKQNDQHADNSMEFGNNLSKALAEIENQIQVLDKIETQKSLSTDVR